MRFGDRERNESGTELYIATEIVASGFGVGEAGAQRPEHTHQFTATRPRSASTARPRSGVAHNQ